MIPLVVTSNNMAKARDLKLPAKTGNLKEPPLSRDLKIPLEVPPSDKAKAEDLKQPAKAGNLKQAPPVGLKEPPLQHNPLVGGKHLPDQLSSHAKKRKKNTPVLPTRASALLKPTWDFAELKDLTQLGVAETFSEFAGVHNPSVDDYFGAMQNESRRRQDFSAAS
jgi:hypothetical protein